MVIASACGLMLLYWSLTVGLVKGPFHSLTLLALGAVPLLMSLPAKYLTLVVVVPTIPPCFNTISLGVLA